MKFADFYNVALYMIFFSFTGGKLCNAALKKPAYQISDQAILGRPYPAVLATDGNHNTNLMLHTCAISGRAVNPWWAVDLGGVMRVHFVVLTTCKR